MPIPKQYVAFEVEWSASGVGQLIVGFHPIVAGRIVELAERPGVDEAGTVRYGQVMETGELVATFAKREMVICPILSNE